MLTITVPGQDSYDEAKSEFITIPDFTINLQHSLVSLSKWESKWEKPFLGAEQKTTEETLSYVECMSNNPEVNSEVFTRLTNDNLTEINNYLEARMTATWFAESKNPSGSREVITAEIIYYWMISLNIPLECQHWHLNRLFTFIRVCNEKNAPSKKMSRSEVAARNRKLNDDRRASLKTQG